MALKTLDIACISDINAVDKIFARVKRGDGKLYDIKTKTFQPESYFTPPLTQFIKLSPGTGAEEGFFTAKIELDPKQFPDGDYTIYYYDNSVSGQPYRLVECDERTVFNGDATTPSPTVIAVRILDASVGTITVRNALADIQTKVSAIYTWMKKQPQ